MRMTIKNYIKLFFAIALSQSAGLLGTVFTVSSVSTWYPTLVKPAFNPPSWVFGPVWTLLYVLMGVAAFLIWRIYETSSGAKKRLARHALVLFVFQLALNAWWSIIFFGQQQLGFALLEIVCLWLAIVATIYYFARVSRTAAWLLVPYLMWVSFASYLTYSLWMLN